MATHADKEKFEKHTGKRLRFGILYPQVDTWPKMLERAQFIESLGFDSIWVADHFVYPENPAGDWFEAWTLLAALAARTRTIRIGTLITTIAYRHPAVLARQALTVDHISNGRLELGIGAGGSRYCHTMTGVPVWEPRERVARFGEFIEIVNQMLQNEVTTYEGSYYQVREAQMHPASVQRPRPPLTIAAQGPRMLKIAATYANKWSDFYPGADLTPSEATEIIRQRNEKLDEYAIQLGRDPQTIRRSFAFGYTSDTLYASLDAFDEVIGRYQEAGIDEFIFGYLPGKTEFADRFITNNKLLERIAKEAIPAIKNEA